LTGYALACPPWTQPIAAALIAGAVGALGIVGTAFGSHNTRKATEAAIEASAADTRATLAAAREDRLWDKRCAAYEETLAEVRHRQMKRRHDLRGLRWDEATEQQQAAFFDSYQPPNWFQAQARMTAYASRSVLDAFEASENAHLEVRARYLRYKAMADDNREASQTGNLALAHDGRATVDARHEVDPALDLAEQADQALRALIRDELSSKPEAATLPVPVRPERRSIWQVR